MMVIINMISLTSVLTQLLLVILCSLGFIFYKYNQSVSTNIHQEMEDFKTEESVKYFSPTGADDAKKSDSSFENYDDYSAFSRDKELVIDKNAEIVESTSDDYVNQNTTPTAIVDDDFEVVSFNLQAEQENGIVMSSQEDIKRVFLNQSINDSATRSPKKHN
ncbi:MAG: hypothetical protein MUF58_10025 [Arcicella sp.]|jgi:hypothetical protein|nr:hypothetical protein [Arcicella sp.]